MHKSKGDAYITAAAYNGGKPADTDLRLSCSYENRTPTLDDPTVTPNMTFGAFHIRHGQRSIRVLYSNHADTPPSGHTQRENRQESERSRGQRGTPLVSIHVPQSGQ
jgi:hypothetical protein